MPPPPKPEPAPVVVAEAPISSASVTTTTSTGNQTNQLDAWLVLSGMAIIAFVLGCLFFVHVPQENLPIVSGLAGTLLGTVIGGYAAYRWGASDAMKRLTATSSTAPSA